MVLKIHLRKCVFQRGNHYLGLQSQNFRLRRTSYRYYITKVSPFVCFYDENMRYKQIAPEGREKNWRAILVPCSKPRKKNTVPYPFTF